MKQYLNYFIKPSIFRRIVLGEMIAISLLLLIQIGFTYRAMNQENMENQFIDSMNKLSESFAEVLSVPTLSDSAIQTLAQRFLTTIVKLNPESNVQESELFYRVWNHHQVLLAASKQEGTVQFPKILDQTYEIVIHGEPWKAVAKKSHDGSVIVLTALSQKTIWRLFASSIVDAIPVMLFVALIFTIIIAWSTRRGLAPLYQISSLVKQRDHDDLSLLDLKIQHTELVPLIESINSLLFRLAQSQRAEHAFFADAAHELRTPLAAMNAQAYVVAHTKVREEKVEALLQFERGVERAGLLLSKLLTLSRLESTSFEVRIEHCNLTSIVQESLAQLVSRTLERNIELSYECNESIFIAMSEQNIHSIMDNLLENALRHTPSGGLISVTIQRFEHTGVSWVRVNVIDTGSGVPEIERTRIFDRFYRIVGTPGFGSGLGLPIVKKILQLHDGRIEVRDAIDGGAVFSFELPCA